MIKIKRGQIENLNTQNPVLEAGQPCVGYDTGGGQILKIGDGTTNWQNLPQIGGDVSGKQDYFADVDDNTSSGVYELTTKSGRSL